MPRGGRYEPVQVSNFTLTQLPSPSGGECRPTYPTVAPGRSPLSDGNPGTLACWLWSPTVWMCVSPLPGRTYTSKWPPVASGTSSVNLRWSQHPPYFWCLMTYLTHSTHSTKIAIICVWQIDTNAASFLQSSPSSLSILWHLNPLYAPKL